MVRVRRLVSYNEFYKIIWIVKLCAYVDFMKTKFLEITSSPASHKGVYVYMINSLHTVKANKQGWKETTVWSSPTDGKGLFYADVSKPQKHSDFWRNKYSRLIVSSLSSIRFYSTLFLFTIMHWFVFLPQ